MNKFGVLEHVLIRDSGDDFRVLDIEKYDKIGFIYQVNRDEWVVENRIIPVYTSFRELMQCLMK